MESKYKTLIQEDLFSLGFEFIEEALNRDYYRHSDSGFKLEVASENEISLFDDSLDMAPEYIFKKMIILNTEEMKFFLERSGILKTI